VGGGGGGGGGKVFFTVFHLSRATEENKSLRALVEEIKKETSRIRNRESSDAKTT